MTSNLFREGISNYVLIVLFLFALMGAGTFASISVIGSLLFLYITIAGFFLPGILIFKISGLKLKNTTSTLFVSYGIGYGIWAIIYSIFIFANIHYLSHYILHTVSVLTILYFIFRRNRIWLSNILCAKNRDNLFLLLFLGVLLLFCFFVYQYPLQSALNIGYQDMFFDNTYWFKNCVASTKGYPLPELSVLGNTLCWHLFSCFNIALFHFATGIEIYDLCFSLSYVWHIFLLVGGVYALVNEFISKRKYVYTACCIILFCSSIEPYTLVYYLEHMYACTLGVADGMALSLFSILVFVKCIKEYQIDYRLAFLFLLLMVATIGAKSPYGSLVLVGAAVGLVYISLKNRKIVLSSFIMLLIMVSAFMIINKVFIIDGNALTSSTSSHKLTLDFSTVGRPPIISKVLNIMESIGVSKIFVAPLLVIPFILSTHIGMPLLAICLLGLLKIRKDISLSNDTFSVLSVSLLAMVFAGISIFIAFNHPGFSQVYFLFACIPFSVVLAFIIIDKYFGEFYVQYKKYLYALMVCSLCATFLFIKPTFLLAGKYDVDPTRKSFEGTSVTRNEIIGLRWVRDNLPEDAILLTNKVLELDSGKRSFVTSAYSERQVYLEGWVSTNLPNNHIVNDRIELMKRYFNGDKDAYMVLKNEGVGYVVIFNSISHIEIPSNKILYENDEIKITTL